MPPKGWRKDKREIGRASLQPPTWRPEFKPFGHRLNFLSAEGQQLNTGKLKILPPKNPEKREPQSD